MADVITSEIKKEIERMRPQFPTEQALLIPLLHLIQKSEGWISMGAMQAAAEYLHLPLGKVREVVTFYTMFNQKPVGQLQLQVCTNLSCFLNGADHLMHCLEKRLGVGHGQTTADGKYTLTHVECLASCGTAPVMQVNDDYYESLNEQSLEKLMQTLDQKLAKGPVRAMNKNAKPIEPSHPTAGGTH